jgi:hypothetical protein
MASMSMLVENSPASSSACNVVEIMTRQKLQGDVIGIRVVIIVQAGAVPFDFSDQAH